jgi:hypothetical protein
VKYRKFVIELFDKIVVLNSKEFQEFVAGQDKDKPIDNTSFITDAFGQYTLEKFSIPRSGVPAMYNAEIAHAARQVLDEETFRIMNTVQESSDAFPTFGELHNWLKTRRG